MNVGAGVPASGPRLHNEPRQTLHSCAIIEIHDQSISSSEFHHNATAGSTLAGFAVGGVGGHLPHLAFVDTNCGEDSARTGAAAEPLVECSFVRKPLRPDYVADSLSGYDV